MRTQLSARAAIAALTLSAVFRPAFGATVIAKVYATEPEKSYLEPRPPNRLALVIGNAAYPTARLDAAPADAAKIKEALEKANFVVTPAADVDTQDNLVRKVLTPFLNNVKRGDIAVIYYFGHGFSHGVDNFLIPVSASTAIPEDDIYDTFLPERTIRELASERQPGLVLLFLDACRTVIQFSNPGAPAPLVAQALPSQNEQGDMVISYAADYGSSAYAPDADAISYYTNALANVLPNEGVELSKMFKSLTSQVSKDSGYKQKAWSSSDLESEFYFRPSVEVRRQELGLWKAALDEGTRDAVDSFLHSNRGSDYAGQAMQWLADHPQGAVGAKLRFTQVSPLSAEIKWDPTAAHVELPKVSESFGIPRKATLGENDDIRELASAPSTQLVSFAGRAIVTSKSAFAKTSSNNIFNLPFGTSVDLGHLNDGQPFAMARVNDVSQMVELRNLVPDNARVVPVGRSLAEVQLEPSDELESTISSISIRDVLLPALAKAKVVGWISISTPYSAEKRQKLVRSLQATFVRYQLIAHGVASSKITVVENDRSNEGNLRVRIFGTPIQ